MEKIISNGYSFSIPVPGNFSFKECLTFLNRSSLECLHEITDNTIRKLIIVEDAPLLLEVSPDERGKLNVNVDANPITPSIQNSVSDYIREWFDMKTDLRPFYKIASQDEILKDLVERYRGLRVVGISDLFEALSWAIIGQQINLRFAYTLKQRFVYSFGDEYTLNNKTYWSFPTVDTVSRLDTEELRKLQFTQKKSEYIIGLARLMNDGTVSREELSRHEDFSKIRSELLKIRGVGAWTANYVLMKCFRARDAFPIEDAGLHNAIKNQLNSPRKPTLDRIREYAANWGDWRAYATFYLWRSLI